MNSDFSQGKIGKNIITLAVPLTVAQLVQILYNVIDRVYIGHLAGDGSLALTGIGLTFPIITLITAFSCLFGTGGAPLFSIARGSGRIRRAKQLLGNVFVLLAASAVFLFLFCYFFRRPILYLFGASDDSYIYADAYLKIYLWGTPFAMMTVGLNGFINAQGFPKTGMLTTVIGAVLNLVLDPLFIFGLHMGVRGAAVATVLSQMCSALWVLRFLTGKKVEFRIEKEHLSVQPEIVKDIVGLGLSGFIMQATNGIVQIVCNSSLQHYGGDVYVGIMTVLNSVREVLSLPVMGITSGAQPVLSYNYGAKQYHRVKEGIRFTAGLGFGYTIFAWLLVLLFPRQIFHVFSNDASMVEAGVRAMHIYFFGFCFMAFQFSGQTVFQSLGYAKNAIFFSLFRKVIIVVPLTLLFPVIGFGVHGVFLAEPISNAIGGLACFLTMLATVYTKLETDD